VLVGVTGGAILLATWVSGQRTVSDLSKLLIEPTARRTTAQLDSFFGEIAAQVEIGRGWGERGGLDPTDYETLNDVFVPILEARPQISSMMVANSRGEEYLLLRDALHPSVWHNRVVRADEWGTRVFNRRWDTQTGEAEESFGTLDYDPRRRIWYQEALGASDDGSVFWTEPVIFFITKDPGVTASTSFEVGGEDGPETVVVAFDLLLLDISRFTSSLRVSEHGRAFVLIESASDGSLQVVGLPLDERWGSDDALRDSLMHVPPDQAVVDSGARLATVEELEIPQIERAVEVWDESGRTEAPLAFRSGGGKWLAEFHPYELGRNTYWIGVTLPERDLLGGLRVQRVGLTVAVSLILIVGLWRAATLARRFSNPIESLVRDAERIREGDLEAGEPIDSGVREFQHLFEAQESMREGIAARMKLEKVERDLDIARGIQQGLLPTSAPHTPGFRVEGWSLPADETGGDYFDWMTLPDGRTLITLADVTGHGIGPALIVAVCRAYMRAAATGDDVALSQAVERVNDLLVEDMPDGRFVTAAIGVLDHERSEMKIVSAGQGPLLFRHAGTGETELWGADDLPLGIAPGISLDNPRRVAFEPGDALVLTTDGFFEWANAGGEQYGMDRLRAFVGEHAGLEPSAFIRALYDDVRAFSGGTVQPDDLTAVVVKRTGGSP